MSESLILMDINSVSDFLKVKPETIYSWIHYKQIPNRIYRKLGKRPRFIREELIKWFLDGAEITKRRNNIC